MRYRRVIGAVALVGGLCIVLADAPVAATPIVPFTPAPTVAW